MIQEYDAIVVGGGLAGLTSAAYLCRYGYKTLLCEKRQDTGGLVGTFWHQGFAFDAGIRAIENTGIIFPMLENLGIDVEFIRNPVSIGIENQWTRLVSRDSLQNYASMLAAFFPDCDLAITQIVAEIKKVTDYMDVLYGIDNPLFWDSRPDLGYIMKTLLPWLLKYHVNIRKASRLNEPVDTYLTRFTGKRALIDMIVQHFFQNTPAFFALSYFGLYLDYHYPRGGTGVLAQKMAGFVRSAGGEIRTQAAVYSVDASKREIRIEPDEICRFKKLVWAADQKTLYSALNGVDSPRIENLRQQVELGQGGDSVLTLYLGVNLDTGYFRDICGAHAFYTPAADGLSSLSSWEAANRRGKDALLEWISLYLARTTYEISCPVLRDASLAPEGKTGMIVSTLMDYRLVRHMAAHGDYEPFKELCAGKIIDVLERSAFPGIRGNLAFSLCSTPLTIERETGNAQGAITGWAFTNSLVPAENRLPKIAKSVQTPIDNVVQCGQWTFSPSGLPVSVLTGKLAADAVNKALNGVRP